MKAWTSVLPHGRRPSVCLALHLGATVLLLILWRTIAYDRARAARAPDHRQDSREVEPLATQLEDEQWHVRAAAAAALGLTNDARAVEPLIQALAGSGPERRAALWALGQNGDARAVEPVIRILGDRDPDTQKAARQCLADLRKMPGSAMWFAEPAGKWGLRNRIHATHWLVRGNDWYTAEYRQACMAVLSTTASLTYSVVMACIVIGLPWFFAQLAGEKGVFTWGQWGIVTFVAMPLVQDWPAAALTGGSAAFLTLALMPAVLWIALGLGRGAVLWTRTTKKARSFVCTADLHRFRFGAGLPWLVRWSARWLAREKRRQHEALDDYFVCRSCGQGNRLEATRVVAVLDSQRTDAHAMQGRVLKVNWLVWRRLFDFDLAEIVSASDEDVERFVVQVQNDTDEFRRRRYEKMRCKVTARLSENTLRILRSAFGTVEATT